MNGPENCFSFSFSFLALSEQRNVIAAGGSGSINRLVDGRGPGRRVGVAATRLGQGVRILLRDYY